MPVGQKNNCSLTTIKNLEDSHWCICLHFMTTFGLTLAFWPRFTQICGTTNNTSDQFRLSSFNVLWWQKWPQKWIFADIWSGYDLAFWPPHLICSSLYPSAPKLQIWGNSPNRFIRYCVNKDAWTDYPETWCLKHCFNGGRRINKRPVGCRLS